MKNYSKKCEEENSPILKIKKEKGMKKEGRTSHRSFALPTAQHCLYLFMYFTAKQAPGYSSPAILFGICTQHTRGKREPNGVEGGEGTNPTAQIRRRLCLQDLGDTYFWSGARQSRTECQPQKWDTGLRIQGNGQQAGISIHSLHWPHPQDLITARAKQIHNH